MSFYNQTPEQKRLQYLEDQLEDERNRREQEQREAYEREKARREERRHEMEEAYRFPDNWNDGFSRGIGLAKNEARAEAADNEKIGTDPNWTDYKPTDFFARWVVQLERGQAVYNEEAQAAQIEIERLEAEIEKVRQSVLENTAKRLEAEDSDSSLIQALRENNPSYLTNW